MELTSLIFLYFLVGIVIGFVAKFIKLNYEVQFIFIMMILLLIIIIIYLIIFDLKILIENYNNVLKHILAVIGSEET